MPKARPVTSAQAATLDQIEQLAQQRIQVEEAYIAALLKAWDQRIPVTKIAERTGTTHQTVSHLIRKHRSEA